ncbi:MAG: hypothetical protein J1F11_12505 [Oscillospiraceae bacterium]|nr:hypothetical protein [Oscillospiraceae bacterium]
MRKKRFLSVIMTFTLMLSFAGCQSGTDTNQIEQISQENQTIRPTVKEDTGSETETGSEPESTQQTEKREIRTDRDWTISQLVSEHLYINGVQFSLPCNIDNIPQGFSLAGEPFEDPTLIPDYILDKCIYDGNNIGSIFYYNERHKKSNEIAVLDIDLENCSEFEFYGISKGDSHEKAIEIFGEPDEVIDKSYLHYYYEDEHYIKLVFYDNSLGSFMVDLSGDMPFDKK